MKNFFRPIRRHVLLVDDQPEYREGGIVVAKDEGCYHMDFTVAAVGTEEPADFGPGDRVLIQSPVAGRRLVLDGAVYRLVRMSDVACVMEP